ncbi:TPA: DUF262 domain-containing protein [Pseudomonas putida]
MQSELKSLSKIFTEVIFRIPDYQRGYSWGEKQLKDFWSDIEQLGQSKSHYTEVLTLEPVAQESYQRWDDDVWIIESKRYSPMYVVDGQQRLTTAVILIQSILDKMREDQFVNFTDKDEIRKKYICEIKGRGISKSYLFGYEKDNPSYEFLKQNIYGDESINHSLCEETIYTKNLIAAKKFFEGKLKDLDDEALSAIYTKLTQHLQFNIFYIEKDLDVFITFETMNNRGKLLSHLELLKNRLIYLSTKFDVEKRESEHLRKAINESWKSVYHYLGLVDSEKFNDDVFLRTHYVIYFGHRFKNADGDDSEIKRLRRYLRTEHFYKDQLLESFFTPKRLHADAENPLSIEEVYDYASSMKAAVKTFYHVAYPDAADWTPVESKALAQINRLANYNLFLLIVVGAVNFKKSKGREELFVAAERFGFVSRAFSYHFDIELFELVIRAVTKEESPENLTKVLEEFADKIIKNAEFKDTMRNLGKASNGFYGWFLTRYFMYEYEQHLRELSKTSRQLLPWIEGNIREAYDEDFKTVEHIYPQRANDNYWKTQFAKYSVPERNKLRNSLGNLLPVSHGKNASLSNRAFRVKKGSERNQVGYSYGCLSEIQVAMSEDWGARQILRRGIYLLEFMEKRWGLKIGDVAKKIQWLGLEFVLDKEGISAQAIVADSMGVPEPPAELVEERDDIIS